MKYIITFIASFLCSACSQETQTFTDPPPKNSLESQLQMAVNMSGESCIQVEGVYEKSPNVYTVKCKSYLETQSYLIDNGNVTK